MFHHPSKSAKTGRIVAREGVNFGLQYSLHAQATPVNERPQTKQPSSEHKNYRETVSTDCPSSNGTLISGTKYKYNNNYSFTPENDQLSSTENPSSKLHYSHSNSDVGLETRSQRVTPSFRELNKVQRQVIQPSQSYFSDQNVGYAASFSIFGREPSGAEEDGQAGTTRQSVSAGAQTKNSMTAKVFLPGDRVVFAESPTAPGVPIVYRLPEERQSNPDRLNLDRRRLTMCPILEGEDNLRLLNFQHNLITRIQHLINLKRLIFLDFYDNQIEEISGLSSLRSLRVLMLGKNRLRRITNLESLTKLDVLDLHGNRITKIENLSHLTELRVLNLAGNEITRVSNIMGMNALVEMNLRRNQITTVAEVERLTNLQRLFLSFNNITSFEDVSCLSQSSLINELSLDGNPIAVESVYKQTVLKNMPYLRQLDMKRITEEERRIANVMARKEEEKKKESNKLAVLKEKRRIAISNAQRQWEINQNESDSNAENSSLTICHLAELDGETLYLYGPGSLDALDRSWGTQAVNSLTTISFKFIKFDDILLHFHKIKSRFPSLSNLIFTETSINNLQQINALSMLRRLDSLSINEGNAVTSFTLWKPYTLFRLAHLSIRKINGTEVTAEDIVNAEKLYGTLSHITTSQLPQSRLLSLMGDSRRKPDIDKSKKQENKHERTSSTESVGRAGLQYWPADAIHSRKEDQEFRKNFSRNYIKEITQTAILTDSKKKELEKIWPFMFNELVQEAVSDMKNMDTFMKNSFEQVLQKK